MDIKKCFTEHPASVDESYWQHFWVAFKMAIQFFFLSIVALVHAVFPFLFVTTGSDLLCKMHEKLQKRRENN